MRMLVEEVRTLRREVESCRAAGVARRAPSPICHPPAPQSEHPMVAAGPVPMAPLTSPSAASRHVRSHVVETSRAPWHNPPAPAPRSRAPRHCRFPGCTAPPHVGSRVRFRFDHCTSPRCSRRTPSQQHRSPSWGAAWCRYVPAWFMHRACSPRVLHWMDIAIFIAPVVGVVATRRRETAGVRCQ